MNILFLTQGMSLSGFYDIAAALRKRADINRLGFYVADSGFFEKFSREYPDISSGEFEILKEWEILKKASRHTADIKNLKILEEKYGDPVLWNALSSDRRICLGSRASLEQNSRPRFSHERMLAIAEKSFEELEKLFSRLEPDAVIGFVCVTIGDYITYLLAKEKKIPFFNLRPTGIKNYFFAGESIFEPSDFLKEIYNNTKKTSGDPFIAREAEAIIASIREHHMSYEGYASQAGISHTENSVPVNARQTYFMKAIALLKRVIDYNWGKYSHDTHFQGFIYPAYFKKIKKKLRIRYQNFLIGKHYLSLQDIKKHEYAYYPLHKEPDVTMLVYGRHRLNQIELIRNIAKSLPVGMKLVVKEHPVCTGYRKTSYYRSILKIPNVLLASPEIPGKFLAESSKIVFVISGFSGLEALVLKKPLIVSGRVPYAFFPETMVRYVTSFDRLAEETAGLLKNHSHEERLLVNYIISVIKASVPVDWYTRIIKRSGVGGDLRAGTEIELRRDHVGRLADYLLKRMNESPAANMKPVLQKKRETTVTKIPGKEDYEPEQTAEDNII